MPEQGSRLRALFGALGAGVAAAHLGAPLAVAAGGFACVAAGMVFGRKLEGLRPHARELIVAQQLAGGRADRGLKPMAAR